MRKIIHSVPTLPDRDGCLCYPETTFQTHDSRWPVRRFFSRSPFSSSLSQRTLMPAEQILEMRPEALGAYEDYVKRGQRIQKITGGSK